MNPEPLEHVLKKRETFKHMWALLAPDDKYSDLYNQCMREWNKRSYRQQQQLYWFIREKRKRGEVVHDNPLYALTYIKPHPYNWNGKEGIQTMMKTKKMVSAFYDGHFGIYTLCESTIFEMTHITPLNYKDENS